VNNNIFTPGFGVVGNNLITYTYLAVNGCAASATDTMLVEIYIGGLNDNTETADKLTITPNPVISHCRVNGAGITVHSKANLYDQTARCVKQFEVESTPFNLDCNDLPGGLYFLDITTPAGKRYTSKLMVLRP
jgi:hypothetical protein